MLCFEVVKARETGLSIYIAQMGLVFSMRGFIMCVICACCLSNLKPLFCGQGWRDCSLNLYVFSMRGFTVYCLHDINPYGAGGYNLANTK